jgi:hypothetical protein
MAVVSQYPHSIRQVRRGPEKSGPFFHAKKCAKIEQRRILGRFIPLHRAAPEGADRAGLVAEGEPRGQARGEVRLDDCELAGLGLILGRHRYGEKVRARVSDSQ